MAVALYVRVSSQEQAESGYSVGEQEERLKSYCSAVSWDIFKVYVDPGFTGSNTNRPGLQELLRDAAAHRFNKVVVYKLDRLSRSQKDTLELIEDRFLKNDIDFISISENFDTSTPFGRAMIGILAVFAQLEREQIKERMQMGKVARAKEGKWSGGSCKPIGYDYIDGELVVNPYEKIQVQRIFDLAKSGKSPYQIYKLMGNYKTKYGPWNDVSVRKVLQSKTYCGFIKFSGKWYEGNHEPFISLEDWEEVQRMFAARTQKRMNPGKATTYLGGFLVCAHCGGKYSKHCGRKKTKSGVTYPAYQYYECNSRAGKSSRIIHDPNCKNKIWRMDALDEMVFDQIRKIRLEGSAPTTSSTSDQKRILEAEIDKITAQIEKLVDLYSSDKIPLPILNKKVEALMEEQTGIQNEIDSLDQDRMDPEEVRQLINSFDDILKTGSFEDIRSILESLIDHIVIDNEDITIFWRF